MRSCLVMLYGTSDLLAALCAVKYYALQYYQQPYDRPIVVVHNPGLTDSELQESLSVIKSILDSLNWPSPIAITAAQMAEVTRSNRWTSAHTISERFRRIIGTNHVDDIFYSHNIVGVAADLAMQAYPSAERLTSGESLGSVANKAYYMTLERASEPQDQAPAPTTSHRITALLRSPEKFKHLKHYLIQTLVRSAPMASGDAQKAVLILPLDYSGDYLVDKTLLIVPKEIVLDVIKACQPALTDLMQYSRDLLVQVQRPPYLMLLGNLSDGGFASIENEVSMYEATITQHVPRGADVFIKAHPLAVAPVAEQLCRRLQAEYRPHQIPQRLSRYPIELWYDLISACRVITLSYSSISLPYLYNIPVILSITDALIDQFIQPEYRSYYKKSSRIYQEMRANLATWDSQSLIWKGPIR